MPWTRRWFWLRNESFAPLTAQGKIMKQQEKEMEKRVTWQGLGGEGGALGGAARAAAEGEGPGLRLGGSCRMEGVSL